jgi:hypothetical protein
MIANRQTIPLNEERYSLLRRNTTIAMVIVKMESESKPPNDSGIVEHPNY